MGAMRKRRRTATGPAHSVAIALICIFGGPPTEMVAQEPLPQGARVRVTAPDCELRGQAKTYQAFRGDMLVFLTTECPLVSVTRLDVHRGQKRRLAKGALLGGLGGIAAGVFLGAAWYDFCVDWSCNQVGFAALGVLLGGAAGTLLGAGVGALITSDRWEEVPLEGLVVSLAPQRDGRPALGFSVGF